MYLLRSLENFRPVMVKTLCQKYFFLFLWINILENAGLLLLVNRSVQKWNQATNQQITRCTLSVNFENIVNIAIESY